MSQDVKRIVKKVLVELKRDVTKIQGIMEEASTSRPTEYMFSPTEYFNNFEKDYKRLYQNIESN